MDHLENTFPLLSLKFLYLKWIYKDFDFRPYKNLRNLRALFCSRHKIFILETDLEKFWLRFLEHKILITDIDTQKFRSPFFTYQRSFFRYTFYSSFLFFAHISRLLTQILITYDGTNIFASFHFNNVVVTAAIVFIVVWHLIFRLIGFWTWLIGFSRWSVSVFLF